MKLKKQLSLLLVAAILLTLLPVQAFAAGKEPDWAALRTAVTQSLKAHDEQLNVSAYNVPVDQWSNFFFQILNTDASLWFVKKKTNYSSSNNKLIVVFFEYMDAQEEQVLRNAVDGILAECIKPGMTDIQKALALHDYIALNCEYDLTYSKRTVYDTLITGISVCQGYADSYRLLLGEVGIDSRLAVSDAMNHAWNIVQIGGKWYHVDVTWDDPVYDTTGYVDHTYFLCSDSRITELEHHSWEADYACTDTSFDSGMYWADSNSGIVFLSAEESVIRRDGFGEFTIHLRNEKTGSEKLLYKETDSMYECDGYWMYTTTTGLSFWNGELYFGDLMNIYAMKTDGTQVRKVKSIQDFAGWHFFGGSYAHGGKLQLNLIQSGWEKREKVNVTLEHQHTWSQWVETVKPDATRDGVNTRTCSVCGAKEEMAVDNNLFTDVKQDRFESAILWAYYGGITTGTGDGTTFSPENACTRKQIVTFLWRAAGEPEPKSMVNPFKDVKSDRFEKAILWAYYEGITAGTGDGSTFSPENTCTRKQIVTFLWRYHDEPSPKSMVNQFVDVKNDRFTAAILWAAEQGITTGTGDGSTFSPENPCTRKQIVTFLYRDLTA